MSQSYARSNDGGGGDERDRNRMRAPTTARSNPSTWAPVAFEPDKILGDCGQGFERHIGTDMRREPIEVRKATLASILRKGRPGVRLDEHLEHPDGALVFAHACKMGVEGIVSKRLGSRYRSGRSPDWLKFKRRRHRS